MYSLNMPHKLETINPISDIRSTPEIVCSLRVRTKDKNNVQARIAVASEDSIYYIVDDQLKWKIQVRFFFSEVTTIVQASHVCSFDSYRFLS